MNRIQEIIELERQAQARDGSASERNWRAAELIWQELQTGKTKTRLAEEIGKHRTHVLFASRCWELVGRYFSNGNRPSFYVTYNSDIVRGRTEEAGASAAPAPPRRNAASREAPAPEPDARETASAWIAIAAEVIGLLAEHPVTWQFLQDADADLLAATVTKAENVLADIKMRKVSES